MNLLVKQLTFSLQLLLVVISGLQARQKYEPNWDSLDTRPLPQWYDDAKIGIFVHWGVFSVPSFHSEWFWDYWITDSNATDIRDFMKENYPPNFTYQDFANDFTAEFFNATEWAEIFANSGAKYVVLTSKHHEGYTLWPSKYSYSWNAKDVGPHRDLLGELSKAVRSKKLTFGLYHSLYEWFHPIYLLDKENNWTTNKFAEYKILPEMHELVETYHPEIIWSDGDWEASDSYWGSTKFLAWLYNDSPVRDAVVVNDRWGIDIPCKHGDFYTCQDRYNPRKLLLHKWENAMTLDRHSWGFRRNAKLEDYLTTFELLNELASTISCGGNLLINVGPTKDGIISPIFQDRLKDLGKWLSINGEAIYFSKPWTVQNDSLTENVWYTSKKDAIYIITLFWPKNNDLTLKSIIKTFKNPATVVSLLGNEEIGTLTWRIRNNRLHIVLPDKAIVNSDWAYVFKVEPGSKVDSF